MSIPLHAVETVAPGGWLYMCFTGEGVALQYVADCKSALVVPEIRAEKP